MVALANSVQLDGLYWKLIFPTEDESSLCGPTSAYWCASKLTYQEDFLSFISILGMAFTGKALSLYHCLLNHFREMLSFIAEIESVSLRISNIRVFILFATRMTSPFPDLVE